LNIVRLIGLIYSLNSVDETLFPEFNKEKLNSKVIKLKQVMESTTSTTAPFTPLMSF